MKSKKHSKVTLIQQALLPWFYEHKRGMPWRKNRTAYRVWISELMLQQTRVSQATPFFIHFMKKFPSIKRLAQASQEEVLKAWEGLGYYARARNAHKSAKMIHSEYNGRFPTDPQLIEKLPGIGPYTTAAIASLAFNQCLAVVDGNVIRVLARLFAYPNEIQSQEAKKWFQDKANSLLEKETPGDWNEAIMELGALVCLPKNPQCDVCPLNTHCSAFKKHNPLSFPVKKPKKKTPCYEVGAGVVQNEIGEVLIAQRAEHQMLGGLWEFPGGKVNENESIKACIERELVEEIGIQVTCTLFLVRVKHAYSHFSIDMQVYMARHVSGTPSPIIPQQVKWETVERLRRYPFSKADIKIIEALEKSI
jgi:A/G-specific adenine glycosylase